MIEAGKRPGAELVAGADGMVEGLPDGFADGTWPKFKPDGILLAYAGGGAGLFSAIIGGWANGAIGSTPVTREVQTMTTRYLLDPTSERHVAERQRLDRPAAITGKTIGLLDISKPRGNIFLDQLERRLTDAGATVLRFAKPTFTKPAPVDLRHEIATQCELVIEALAD